MNICPACRKALPEAHDARFCPFCGRPVAAPGETAPGALDARLRAEKKPGRKYEIIMEALAASPDDFEANRALLFHGRLHERMSVRGGSLSFDTIKCHLMSVFETPQAYSDAELDEKYAELLRGPQLQRVMALSGDADAFFEAYLYRLAREYMDMFIAGSSKNSTLLFGVRRSPKSFAEKCAPPARAMLAEIAASRRLTERERALLLGAVRAAYAQVFAGFADLLEA